MLLPHAEVFIIQNVNIWVSKPPLPPAKASLLWASGRKCYSAAASNEVCLTGLLYLERALLEGIEMDGIVRKQDANIVLDFNKHFICMNYAVRRVTADTYIYMYSGGPKTAQSAARTFSSQKYGMVEMMPRSSVSILWLVCFLCDRS